MGVDIIGESLLNQGWLALHWHYPLASGKDQDERILEDSNFGIRLRF
jgi:hypothetical protein